MKIHPGCQGRTSVVVACCRNRLLTVWQSQPCLFPMYKIAAYISEVGYVTVFEIVFKSDQIILIHS